LLKKCVKVKLSGKWIKWPQPNQGLIPKFGEPTKAYPEILPRNQWNRVIRPRKFLPKD